MPSINLPTIDFTVSSGSNKQELEQIMDTLTKYRKELNFLLMNLDADNMPAIAGYIEDAEGNISSIQQTIDGINITVADALGDISNLQIQSDNISAIVSSNTGNIASLVIRAGLIETMVGDNAGNISTLSQTAQGIQAQVSNNAGAISTVTQTAQGIQTQVTNNAGQISSVVQTVNGLSSVVTSQNGQISSVQSSITQLSASISSKVSYSDYTGTQIVSLIEQSPSSITLSANKIDLNGITTVNRMLRLGATYEDTASLLISSSASLRVRDGFNLEISALGSIELDSPTFHSSNAYFSKNVDVDRDLDVGGSLKVDGDPVVTSSHNLTINTTSYGIDIRRLGYSSITIKWGANIT